MSELHPPVLYGVFARWPQDGVDWIHPEDVKIVRRLIPSNRVFRRDLFDGAYNHMRYGDACFRVRPALWRVVPHGGFDVGEWIEIRSLLGRNEPGLALIREMVWHEDSGEIHFYVDRHPAAATPTSEPSFHISSVDVERERHYTAEDLQPVDHIPLEHPDG